MSSEQWMRSWSRAATEKKSSSVAGGTSARAVVLASADAAFRHRLSETLTSQRWRVMEASGGAEALAYLESQPALALLVDTWLPDLEVGEFAEQLAEMYPALDVLRVDAVETALERRDGDRRSVRNPHRGELLYALRQAQEISLACVAASASDDAAWNVAPVVVPGVLEVMSAHESGRLIGSSHGMVEEVPASVLMAELPAISNRNEESAADVHALPIAELVGESAAMRELVRLIRAVAERRTAVLLQGPTGSGKEVVAQALHRLSPRRNKAFTVLNCAAIPESLLEAELFGHARGAFTGAVTSRTGRIEAAHQGTLFLDEIGEMPAALQAKLLRFLENGELQRVGENENVRVDVRVIAATHQPLEEHIETGKFRADLYHRITVFPIWVPALVERMDDLPLLANHFLARMGEELPIKRLNSAAMQKLHRHHWPGNVRELAHVLERAVILSGNRAEISEEFVKFSLGSRA